MAKEKILSENVEIKELKESVRFYRKKLIKETLLRAIAEYALEDIAEGRKDQKGLAERTLDYMNECRNNAYENKE